MDRTDRFVSVEGLEVHYSAWGDPTAPPVVCVHGLTRNGRDFDPIARELADEYRVLCPDVPGRGWSEWASDPEREYADAHLATVLTGFCDALDLDELRWIGTSMGGVQGIRLAGGELADRITHLVVNDISPEPDQDAEQAAIERIATYAPDPPVVDRMADLEAYFRDLYEGRFSPLTDDEWRRLTVTSARRTDDGRLTPNYDPDILAPALADADADDGVEDGDARTETGVGADATVDPWDRWGDLAVPTLVVQGSDSAILPDPVLEAMLAENPSAESLVVDSGHAPSLNVPEQIDPIREFLAR